MTVVSRPVPATSRAVVQGEVPLHDRRVTVDGINTQYLEAGTGSPLLLLHGHEQSAASWRWVIPALAKTHRVLALSLPGHGGTDPAVGGYAPGRDLTPFVADFLSTLGIGTLDLVGNSVGGTVALRLASTVCHGAGCRCSPTAGICRTWSTPSGLPACWAPGSPKTMSRPQ